MSTGTMANPWTKKATNGEGGGDFELPPGGSYGGYLVGMIDIGTQKDDAGKERRKVLLVFELTAEHDTKGQTFKVMREFTFSLDSRSNLRAFLEGWTSRKFAEDEEVDLSQFIGAEGIINLTEGISQKKRKFVDVASVQKPMKGMMIPPATVTPFAWSVDEANSALDTPPIPEWVPFNYGRKVVDDIKASKEWQSLPNF